MYNVALLCLTGFRLSSSAPRMASHYTTSTQNTFSFTQQRDMVTRLRTQGIPWWRRNRSSSLHASGRVVHCLALCVGQGFPFDCMLALFDSAAMQGCGHGVLMCHADMVS